MPQSSRSLSWVEQHHFIFAIFRDVRVGKYLHISRTYNRRMNSSAFSVDFVPMFDNVDLDGERIDAGYYSRHLGQRNVTRVAKVHPGGGAQSAFPP